jgi:hypothetical protein
MTHCDPRCPLLGCASCPFAGGTQPEPDKEDDD